jgi:trimeric autotransporter adhesin
MNSFKRIALVTAAALASTFFVAVPQAQAAITNGYVLSDSLAAGARGVTVLADTTKAEAGVNAVVVLTTGEALAATADDNVTLEVAGPASFTDYTAAGSNPTGVTLTSLGKLFTFTATTTAAVNLPTNVKLTVNGAGTVTVTQKKKVGSTTSVIDIKTIYAGTTAKTNVLSVADSHVRVQDTSTAGTLITSADVATAVAVTNAGTGYINVRAMDAYAAQLSTNGVIQASATGGAVVAWDGTPTTQVNAAAKTGTAGVLYVVQGTANENKPVTTTVTITFNGTVLATKTITFTGRAASILISGVDIAQSNGARTGTYDFVVKDSAGNQLAGITPSADTTKYTSQVTSVSVGGASSATAVQTGGWTCASTSGSSTVRLSYTHTDATVIYSNDFIAACASGVDKYTATLDKKEYKAGEIATLTISATDINGAKVHGAATLGAGVAISGGQLTAVSAATSADVFDTAGSRSIKFTVGNTAGSYNLIVDLPAYVATDSAKVVSYSVVDASGAVSNAEILKSIVALIATINKQIAALQKLILKRK